MSIRKVQCANNWIFFIQALFLTSPVAMATAHALVCVTQLPYGGHATSLAL